VLYDRSICSDNDFSFLILLFLFLFYLPTSSAVYSGIVPSVLSTVTKLDELAYSRKLHVHSG